MCACGSLYRTAIATLSGLEEPAPMEVLLAAESSVSRPGEETISGGRDWPFAVNQEEILRVGGVLSA